jgi:hypothetical protein
MQDDGLQGLSELYYAAADSPIRKSVNAVLDSICSIIAQMSHATTVVVTQRVPESNKIAVRGSFGSLIKEVDMSFALPALDSKACPALVVPNIRLDPRFTNHPLLDHLPYVKSLVAMIIPDQADDRRVVLKIQNPKKSIITCAERWHELNSFCKLVSTVLSLETRDHAMAAALAGPHTPNPLHDQATTFDLEAYDLQQTLAPRPNDVLTTPQCQFLFDTLIKKRSLHSRNGCDYLTLRNWRAGQKPYQVATMASLKKFKPKHFFERIAGEIVQQAEQIYGRGVIGCVVPIPGGSSGEAESFSVVLARAVAEKLDVPCCGVLKAQGVRGKSSPHKSTHLRPYEVTGPVTGPVLVVDDIASSGRHLELAIKSLRAQHKAVYAVAWIGK